VDVRFPSYGLVSRPQWQLFPQAACTMAGCCGLNYSPTTSMCIGTTASSPTLGLSNPVLSEILGEARCANAQLLRRVASRGDCGGGGWGVAPAAAPQPAAAAAAADCADESALLLHTTLDKAAHAPDDFVSAGDAHAWSILVVPGRERGMLKALFFRDNRWVGAAAWVGHEGGCLGGAWGQQVAGVAGVVG
jgi:hypothetical protein